MSDLETRDIPEESGVTRCVIIPGITDIMHTAFAAKAFIDGSDDEAGDDLYCIQFPGKDPEFMLYDELLGRINELRKVRESMRNTMQ